jgi:hypothetical protein
VEEPSVLECLPVVHLQELPESRDFHLKTPVRLGTLEILGRFPALEKIPYVITPFNV